MATFKSVVTKLGQARIAEAIQSGKNINIIEMAVGDGGGKPTQPDAAQTKLIKETYRTTLNSLKLDAKNPNWIIAEAIISASVGGFWMREMGLYADDGALIAVCNMADTYKPTLAEGSGRTQTLRMVITVTDTGAVSLTMDDTLIVATEEYVNDLLAAHEKSRNHPDGTLTEKGFLQLSSSVSSTSETLAATPKAVKAANDNANGRLPSDGTAVAADKLSIARKIAGVAFDGTKDISLTADSVGALPSGGTAVAASKLSMARKIAGVEFDGTKDISLTADSVGALPSGGTAVAANKLATARKIAGVAFDGTKDIAITSGDVGAVQQGGGVGMTTNKVILGWDGTKLRAQVDSTSMGALYCEKNKPTAQETGALPLSGGDLKGSVTTTGEISAQGDIHSDSNIHSSGTIQAAKGVYDSPGVRAYSSNNKPLPKDIGAIERDGCSVAGFVGGNGSAPYMRYAASDTVVELAPRDWVNGNFIQRDGCRAAGFVGGNGADPYMLYTASNTVVQLATRDLVNQNFLTSISRGAQSSMVMDGGMVEAPTGCVLTGGNGNEGNQVGYALYRPLQMRRNGTWLIIEG